MKRYATVLAVVAVAGLGAAAVVGQRSAPVAPAQAATIEVYKSPTCGCCSKWVDHLRAAGFTVRTTDTDQVDAIKNKHGVPQRLRSCHTALADGYVIEGHVPAADLQRLLKERPALAGIAVGGMPVGSPGMEVAGRPADPYDVVAFDSTGQMSVFSQHR